MDCVPWYWMRFYSIILSPLLPSFFAAKPFLFLLYFLLSRSVAEHYNETQSLCMAFVSPRWLNMPNKSLFCTFSSCIKLCVFFLSDGSFVNACRKLLSKTAKEKKKSCLKAMLLKVKVGRTKHYSKVRVWALAAKTQYLIFLFKGTVCLVNKPWDWVTLSWHLQTCLNTCACTRTLPHAYALRHSAPGPLLRNLLWRLHWIQQSSALLNHVPGRPLSLAFFLPVGPFLSIALKFFS